VPRLGMRLSRFASMQLERSIRFANAVGALVVTRRGGIPAMPALAEVQALHRASSWQVGLMIW